MKYLNILAAYLILISTFSCSKMVKGVYFSEMRENPKLYVDNGILTIKAENSIKHSALLIYEINAKIDELNKVVSLSANQGINKEHKDAFKINLVRKGVPIDIEEWKFVWVDPDNSESELHIEKQLSPLTIENESQQKTDMEKALQYINDNSLAVCSKNYIFIGVYSDSNNNLNCSVFSGDWDLINEHKVVAAKIYYVAGLKHCREEDFDRNSPTFSIIDLGKGKSVRYYNFSGAISYENRKLIHYQTTDILNPPHMNAMYQQNEVKYDNIYLPEAYGQEGKYNYNLDEAELAKKSIVTLFSDFRKIEAEYKRL